jgi:hypothetical protein
MDVPFLAFIVVGLPVLVGVGGDLVKRWMRLKERQMEMLGSQTAERAAQYAARTERLEQRVAVLERILTDRSAGIADQIEQLRERPLN